MNAPARDGSVGAPAQLDPNANLGAELTDTLFERVRYLAEREAGLSIPGVKRSMVQSRLSRRLRATGIPSFSSYLDKVETSAGAEERLNMISALTTNVSHFFREGHHFSLLAETLLPQLKERARAGNPIRIWSAGCSTGQEPYSIAMTLQDNWPDMNASDLRILATDIDRSVLSIAVQGIFEARQIEDVPERFQRTFFVEHDQSYAKISQAVRDAVTFRVLNLIEPWPMRRTFDVIFCRNVVIYFSDDTQRTLWPRFADALRPGGWLFLGHSERISAPGALNLEPSGVTSYRKR